MSKDFEAIADKKFKSRKRKFKKILQDEYAKEEFFEENIRVSVEILFKDGSDSIVLYTNADGKIVDGDYSYINEEATGEEPPVSLFLSDEDLDLFKELFLDFKLE
ncbi:MAG: hypothetical protein LBV42_01090 [Methanobrevibacter sp.]|jgi:hypothetical protein|nr:hypothetical protein [Methanobrevibacter sp.]